MAGSGSNNDVPFRRDRELVCIEYPSVVKPDTVNKMIDSLGGLDKLSAVYSNPTHRLELRFRPDDVFCKPSYGDRINTTRVLMKVIRRKPKLKTGDNSHQSATTYRSEILGIIDHTYKFESMIDFQYLPMERILTGTGVNVDKVESIPTYQSLIEKLVPTKLEPLSWLKGDAPLMLTPIVFSRIDRPCDHALRLEPKARSLGIRQLQEKQASMADSHVARVRKRRTAFALFVPFVIDQIPSEPNPMTFELMSTIPPGVIRRVTDAFESRPIWSRNALCATLHLERRDFKYILPSIAYFFTSGPWRGLWVKFGYDPRKLVEAKVYQALDFRVRGAIGKIRLPNAGIGRSRFGFSNVVSIKFNSANCQAKVATIQKDTLESDATVPDAGLEEKRHTSDRYFKFQSGVLPPLHQMFYQLIDIEVDEVQALVHANDGQEITCLFNGGWCAPEVFNISRDIMSSIVRNTYEAMKSKNMDAEGETGTLKSESEGEEDDEEQDEVLPSDVSDEEPSIISINTGPEAMDTQ